MTRAQKAKKRLAVAKDALKQIREYKLSPAKGTFMSGEMLADLGASLSTTTDDDSAKPIFESSLQRERHCAVCAKGTLFVSHVLLFNKVSPRQAYLVDELDVHRLLPEFTRGLLDEFEYLFECKSEFMPRRLTTAQKRQLEEFAVKNRLSFKTSPHNLEFLLKRFIRNKGEYLVLQPRQ